MVFYNYFCGLANTEQLLSQLATVISQMAHIIGWAAKSGLYLHKNTGSSAVSSLSGRNKINTIYSISCDGRWQQFGTTNILVNATYWLKEPCS